MRISELSASFEDPVILIRDGDRYYNIEEIGYGTCGGDKILVIRKTAGVVPKVLLPVPVGCVYDE